MESVSPGQDFQRIDSLGVLQAQHLIDELIEQHAYH
jgi:hypothetical protein